MSRKYKFNNKDGLYFVSFAVVNWIDVFTRPVYCDILVDSLNYSIKNLGLEVFCWCIMPSHVHLIFRSAEHKPEILLGRIKEYTSKQIVKTIEENAQESRKEWMLWMFGNAARKTSNVTNHQFWQHNNKPIELWTMAVTQQKIDYIHNNPIASGFVTETCHWKYSSATDYTDVKGLVDVTIIV